LLQVEKAQETEQKIDVELQQLQATLSNIEEARPFEDLTVSFGSLAYHLTESLCGVGRGRG
jgi:hypothetical protein